MSNAVIGTLRLGDCIEQMQSLTSVRGQVALAFCDPPYNIGFDYDGEYDDSLPPEEYANFSVNWIYAVRQLLKPNGAFWLAIGDEWVADLRVICRTLGFHLRSWIVWYYTFGVHCEKKFTRSHAHLLYFTVSKTNFVFNADAIRVPSARALVYSDKRANPRGRMPDDTWIIRPQDLPEGFPAEGDTWFIPRICGTFKQRQAGAPNQLPEQLLGRIIRACSNPGDLVFDPMCGSGTTLAVAKKLGRDFLGVELSARFGQAARKRLTSVHPGDPLDGPIPQGG